MKNWLLKTRTLSDITVAIIIGIFALVILISIDSFERLHAFSRHHESWELDEFFTAFMVASFGLSVLLFRRSRSLREEITRRREAERLALALARQDALTGIANRRSFEEECERRLARARRQSDRMALMFIDFDRFKQINDKLGHETGDRVLQIISERLKKSVRPDDFLGRLGGDEFAVIIHDAADGPSVEHIAARLLAEISKPVMLLGREIFPSASIGIAQYPEDGKTRETLLKKADSAMYRAKEEGRRRIISFDPEVDSGSQVAHVLELDLPAALSSGQIIPYYQPIINCSSGEVALLEVLARWNHPELGVLSAGDFIPHVEAAGLIPELFTVILTQACSDARGWPETTAIAVNVTPYQLSDRNFAADVLDVLRRNGLSPQRFEIEVTEDALVVDLAMTQQNIKALKAAGIRVALDDFGTGYSSLRQLRELPFDRVKIDRGFISGLGTDPQSEEIVASTLKLCRTLGKKTVAEGIEDKQQFDWVCAHGADAVQGYYNGKPAPAADITAMLRKPPGAKPDAR